MNHHIQHNQQQQQMDGSDVKTRLRAARAAAPTFMTGIPVQQQKGSMNGRQQSVASMNHAGMQGDGGVFGRKKGWADQLADEDALQTSMAGHAAPQHMMQMRPGAGTHAGRQLAYVLPNQQLGASISHPASPIDAQVKFVNSTVENLQNQIKKEEAPKKKRTRTSPEQLRILQKAFATDPMPSSQARLALSKKLGMNARAVQVWFQNRRAKAKRSESMGLDNAEDDVPSGSGTDDDLPPEILNKYKSNSGKFHEPTRGKVQPRAASMSSAIQMPSFLAPPQDSNGYFCRQQNMQPCFFDASAFMEPVEHSFDTTDMVLPGLDFNTPMYGAGYGGSNYAMPMQGMFSLPPGAYDVSGFAVQMQYPSFTDETTNLTADVLGRCFPGGLEDHHGFGPINPLSAILDAQTQDQKHQQNHHNSRDDQLLMNNPANVLAHQHQQQMRRSYSLNDIHSQLTTQQIQTLESIGLPALGQGPTASASTLSCIREEDDHGSSSGSSSGFGTGGSGSAVDQDQLLSTIDDLRMGSFWDTSAPGN